MPRSPSLKRTSPFRPPRRSCSRAVTWMVSVALVPVCRRSRMCSGGVFTAIRTRESLTYVSLLGIAFFDLEKVSLSIEGNRCGRIQQFEFRVAIHVVQQRVRNPELIEASRVLDPANARIRTG